MRRFNKAWFDKYSTWLGKDHINVNSLYCYLFNPSGKTFVNIGFKYWKNKKKFDTHVGAHSSAHNQARRNCEALMNQKQHIQTIICQQSDVMIAPEIQKDIVNASAIETTNAIIKELGNGLFCILVDEARNISSKEQMAVALRFVNREGCVIERFIGIVHVSSTTSLSLKMTIEALFSKYGLSLSSIRGQGYDGASNMRGEFGGLKSLIIKENKSAHYIHCFAHQLQLALVATAKNHVHVALLFNIVTNLLNIVGALCKRRDQLRDKHAERVFKALENNGLVTGKGLNQEIGLKRPSDTRWGSHYGTLINLIVIFSDIIEVLDIITVDGSNSKQKGEA
ncbi:DUF4371 domain-containing protein [Cephalotus follicularis]|uniref:DUF4371 domain-containing protein n=1 Tax=Cephalotus follicularis TaxID=3775 RepID=A0A1Q3BK07_CEPFO|nr:DUF4371 domain-containing protein [Cephalotus follicularis]